MVEFCMPISFEYEKEIYPREREQNTFTESQVRTSIVVAWRKSERIAIIVGGLDLLRIGRPLLLESTNIEPVARVLLLKLGKNILFIH